MGLCTLPEFYQQYGGVQGRYAPQMVGYVLAGGFEMATRAHGLQASRRSILFAM